MLKAKTTATSKGVIGYRGVVVDGKKVVAECIRIHLDRNVAHVDGVHLKAAMLRND